LVVLYMFIVHVGGPRGVPSQYRQHSEPTCLDHLEC
jgi:hypothetical protein